MTATPRPFIEGDKVIATFPATVIDIHTDGYCVSPPGGIGNNVFVETENLTLVAPTWQPGDVIRFQDYLGGDEDMSIYVGIKSSSIRKGLQWRSSFTGCVHDLTTLDDLWRGGRVEVLHKESA